VIIEDSPLPNNYDGPDKAHLDRLEGDMQVDARPGHMRLLYYSE
jgi:hypothetical protein